MINKRGLILIVLILAILPIVNSNGFQCSDGTLLGSCNKNQEFCSGNNKLGNSGFETDSDNDNIPDSFLLDPNAILGKDIIYSTDSYSGSKSIKLTKQWASFDYLVGGKQAITLQPNTEYLFFAYVKGTCNNIRVFASTSQVGTAENILCSGSCTLSPADKNGWKRLAVQFNSNIIKTILPANRGGNPFLSYLRIECADSSAFELYIDNMHLQNVNSQPILTKNCQMCGCSKGLQCTNDGKCVKEVTIQTPTTPIPSSKLAILPEKLLEALFNRDCSILEDDNFKNYCYDQLRECDEINDGKKSEFCESKKVFFEETLPSLNIPTSETPYYKAYKCIEGINFWTKGPCNPKNNEDCVAECKIHNRGLSDLSTSFEEFSTQDYQKINFAEFINTDKAYYEYQFTYDDAFYVFYTPLDAKNIKIEIKAKTSHSTLKGQTRIYSGNTRIASINDDPLVEITLPVTGGIVTLYTEGPVNSIRIIEVVR